MTVTSRNGTLFVSDNHPASNETRDIYPARLRKVMEQAASILANEARRLDETAAQNPSPDDALDAICRIHATQLNAIQALCAELSLQGRVLEGLVQRINAPHSETTAQGCAA